MGIVRIATEVDVQSIDEDLYPHLHDNHIPSTEYIQRVVCSPDYILAVADEGTPERPILVGAATLHIIIQAAAGLKGYIDDLVVISSERRKGYGELLFEYLEDVARHQDIPKIFFTCSPRREPGNKFHIAMGYKLRAAAVDENGTNYYEKKL
ncbi:MAG: hypothetical protein G01um101429_457 [Parcubacteria group bacterium Gr01-1014_29]|nr:MAG: hypothetical protein G01um101429_457 [Parcubacteria group bacterium Gr01-1014_29]